MQLLMAQKIDAGVAAQHVRVCAQTLCGRAWIAAIGMLLAGWAQGASFDCRKASTPVEKMICADAEISTLDEELAASFQTARSKVQNRTALQQEQRSWLLFRETCQNTRCLRDVYRKRIAALRSDPQPERQARRYPPYPDVWGYEFPFPSPDRRHVVSGIWGTAFGDIRIQYNLFNSAERLPPGSGATPPNPKRKILGMQFFFSGERHLLSGSEAEADRRRPNADWDIKGAGPGERISFPDGSMTRVKVVFDQAFDGKCFTSHPYSLEHADASGRVLARIAIVHVHQKPVEFLSQDICNGGATDAALVRSVTDGPMLIPLQDETFLAAFDNGHYVLRFDKNLRTKYVPVGPLYIVDASVIAKIRARHEEKLPWPINEQTINDEVTDYLLKLPRRQ